MSSQSFLHVKGVDVLSNPQGEVSGTLLVLHNSPLSVVFGTVTRSFRDINKVYIVTKYHVARPPFMDAQFLVVAVPVRARKACL